jgi:hypothetical protein
MKIYKKSTHFNHLNIANQNRRNVTSHLAYATLLRMLSKFIPKG